MIYQCHAECWYSSNSTCRSSGLRFQLHRLLPLPAAFYIIMYCYRYMGTFTNCYLIKSWIRPVAWVSRFLSVFAFSCQTKFSAKGNTYPRAQIQLSVSYPRVIPMSYPSVIKLSASYPSVIKFMLRSPRIIAMISTHGNNSSYVLSLSYAHWVITDDRSQVLFPDKT